MKTRRRAVQFNLPGKDETGSNTEKRELITLIFENKFQFKQKLKLVIKVTHKKL